MATLKVLGDTIQIKLNVTEAEFNKVKNYAPDALKVKNDDGDEVFGISRGSAHWSKYGVAFANTDAAGKLFTTVTNPVEDHSNPEAEKAAIKETFAQTLFFLGLIEQNFQAVKTEVDAMEQDAERNIVMES